MTNRIVYIRRRRRQMGWIITYGYSTNRSVYAKSRSSGNYNSDDEKGEGGVHDWMIKTLLL